VLMGDILSPGGSWSGPTARPGVAFDVS